MASTTEEPVGPEGVPFVREEDGSVTARDSETGLARGGATRPEALAQLAEVLALEEGRGEPIDEPGAFPRNLPQITDEGPISNDR